MVVGAGSEQAESLEVEMNSPEQVRGVQDPDAAPPQNISLLFRPATNTLFRQATKWFVIWSMRDPRVLRKASKHPRPVCPTMSRQPPRSSVASALSGAVSKTSRSTSRSACANFRSGERSNGGASRARSAHPGSVGQPLKCLACA